VIFVDTSAWIDLFRGREPLAASVEFAWEAAPERSATWVRAMGLLLAAPGLAPGAAHAGALTGPVLDGGVTVELVDFVEIPASAATPPLTRINSLREAPDGSGRIFVNDLRGRLWGIAGGAPALYLDLAAHFPSLRTSPGLATGFVSLAFHPGFAQNGRFYTVHTESPGATAPNLVPPLAISVVQHSILTEWRADDPGAATFAGTSRELIRIESPHVFHNLGEVAFDPRADPNDGDYGLLYVGAGDFGSVETGQPSQLQRTDSPFGALLRIDPLGGPFVRGSITFPYGIPPGNPFAATPGALGEIYAYGFRNAHRISFDADGSRLVSEIGQANVEEVDRLVAGANYGWPLREGTFASDPASGYQDVLPLPPDDATLGLRYPVAQYDHEEGSAIAGAFVYRGAAASPLHGQLVFGDIVSGRLFHADAQALAAADDGLPATTAPIFELHVVHQGAATSVLETVRAELGLPSLARADLRLGEDAGGELYVLTKQDGHVRRLIACLCGDVDGSGAVDGDDVLQLRETLAALRPEVAVPAKCQVSAADACDVLTTAVVRRALASLPPGIQPACPALP
jgi:glucose/arabinose dehydrogenase